MRLFLAFLLIFTHLLHYGTIRAGDTWVGHELMPGRQGSIAVILQVLRRQIDCCFYSLHHASCLAG
jgi:hypothetical protein